MQVIVTGMHRSGTSVVTRLLNLAGFYVGSSDEMMQGMPDNPGGYWERKEIFELNTKALHAAGVDWNTTLGDEFDTVGPESRKEIVHGFREVVQRLEEHRPWAIKDPRLSVLLPLWRPLLSDPVVVICHRHPLEVARSLQGRDGLPISIGVALWEVYTLAILQNTREIPRVFLSHEELLRSPVETARTLVAQLKDMSSSSIRMPAQTRIKTLVDGKLNRSRTAEDQVADYLGDVQSRLLQSMNTAQGLDDWSLEDLTESTKDLIVFYREMTTRGIERRETGLSLVSEWIESFGVEKDKMAAEIQQVVIDLADAGARYDSAVLDRTSLGKPLESARADRRRLTEELEASRIENADLSGRLKQVYEDMEKLGFLHENLNTEKDRLARELGQAYGEKKEIGLRLESAGTEIVVLHQELEEHRRARAVFNEEMQKSHDDRTGLAARLEQVHEEMQRLGTLLEQINAEKVALGEELRRLYGSNQEIGTKLEFAAEETRNALEKARGRKRLSDELEHELTKAREEGIRLNSTLVQLYRDMEMIGALLEKTADGKQALATELQETYVAKAELGFQFERVNLAGQKYHDELDALRGVHDETEAALRAATADRDELTASIRKINGRLQETTTEFDNLRTWRRHLEEKRVFRMYRRLQALFNSTGASHSEETTGEESRHPEDGA